MFKNFYNMAISKNFIISLVFILLMCTSVAMSVNDICAVDVDESSNDVGIGLDVEDKLENSQIDESLSKTNSENEIGMSLNNSGDILSAGDSYTVTGGSFKKIQNAIISSKNGDTLVLEGDFYSTGEEIELNKSLTITSSSGATLNGKDLSRIMQITQKGVGSTIKGLTFINGNCVGLGAGLYINAKNVTVSKCNFENNYVVGSAAAISTAYNALRSENTKIENCYFKNNHASTSAGAVGAYSNKSKVENCIFDSNYVEGDKEVYGGAIQMGIDIYESYGTVRNCNFTNNWARSTSSNNISHGGAGCVRKGSSYTNCIFINNTADHGGALTFHGDGGVIDCLFVNNTAKTMYGGAISIDLLHQSMNLSVSGSDFIGNKAPLGGAIMLSGMNIDIDKCTFDKNHAFIDGGAINIDAVTVNVANSKFNKNTADNDGGALYLLGKDTNVKDCEFKNNSAIPDSNKRDDGLGGAIYINSTRATIANNLFNYNTARNGSAIYYDKSGKQLTLNGNTLFQNQAWVYSLPIYAKDIYYGDVEKIGAIIHGGNNIAKYNHLDVSNAIYNAAPYSNIKVDKESPVSGATNSGELYQDDREYNMNILLTVKHEDGQVVYNKTLKSSYLGEVNDNLNNLKPGKYYVTAKHFEDTYYKPITNTTTFIVKPKVDNGILKTVTPKVEYNYQDTVVWTLNITNKGPNDSTGVVVRDVLPQGLVWVKDDSNGKYNPKTGELNIGFLAVGDNVVVNIVTTLNKTGVIVNKANVTSNDYDINLNNNKDDAMVNVSSASDLEVVKVVNNSNPNFKDLVQWTISVKNKGPDVAHNVKVTDILPKSLIFVESDGNYDSKTGIWNIGTLNVGKTVKLNIKTRVNSTGDVKNDVSVSADEFEHDVNNNGNSEIIHVKKSADLAIEKSVNVSKANYGDLVKWTLKVRNNGPDASTGVNVTDVLPKGFVYVNSVMSKGKYAGGKYQIGRLAVGESATIDIITRVNGTGNFVNVANIVGNEYDWNLNNNKDDAKTTVNSASDLEVVKVVNNSNPNYNGLVQWTISVKNNGPNSATGVNVTDILPKSLIYVGGDAGYDSKTGIWNVGTLNVGKVVKLNIITRVNATGNVKNVVSVSGREFDYNMSNNVDDEMIHVKKSAELTIEKSVNVSKANYGDLVKWTLKVRNNGPDAATGVNVTDDLPKGFVYVNSVMSKGKYAGGKYQIGNLAVGESATIDIITRVNGTGNFVNVANIVDNEYDWNRSNNDDNTSIIINPASDLEVVKVVNNSNPNYNGLVQWTISVKNNGPDAAHDVKVIDKLPESLIYVGGDAGYDSKTGVWDVGTLNVGKVVKLNIITRINTTGIIDNNVSVSAREFEYNSSNNKNNQSILVNKSCDVNIVKKVNETNPNYLDIVKWTLIASNNGPDKATNVYIKDMLPEGLVLIDAIPSKGYYEEGMWFACCLEKEEVQTLELICKVNKTGLTTNVASISSEEYDHNLSNNVGNETIDVPSAIDLEVIKEVNNETPYFGDAVTWLISVTNHGPDMANNVVLDDVLPAGVIFNNYSATKGEYSNGKWFVGILENGHTEYINITTTVDALGVIVNEANVNASEYDWNRINNYDDCFVDVLPVADLSITKVVTDSNPNYGDIIRWTLTVVNNGPNNATDVVVYDYLPDGVELIESSDYEYEDGIWHIGDLNVGESRELDIICSVSKTGSILNYANVFANEHDPNLFNNYDESLLEVPPASDLAITKTVSKYHYYVGDVLRYAIELVNNGPDAAENIVVDELMDESLKLKSFRASAGDFNKLTKTWEIDSLGAGESARLYLEAVAEEEGVFDNYVSVSSDTYDYDLTNNDDGVSVNVTEKPADANDSNINLNNHKPELNKNIEKYDKNIDEFAGILENNVAGNPILILIGSLVFSLVFLRSNILNKR